MLAGFLIFAREFGCLGSRRPIEQASMVDAPVKPEHDDGGDWNTTTEGTGVRRRRGPEYDQG